MGSDYDGQGDFRFSLSRTILSSLPIVLCDVEGRKDGDVKVIIMPFRLVRKCIYFHKCSASCREIEKAKFVVKSMAVLLLNAKNGEEEDTSVETTFRISICLGSLPLPRHLILPSPNPNPSIL